METRDPLHGGQQQVVQSAGVSVVAAASVQPSLKDMEKGGSQQGKGNHTISEDEQRKRDAVIALYEQGGLDALTNDQRVLLDRERARLSMKNVRKRKMEAGSSHSAGVNARRFCSDASGRVSLCVIA